jgi:LAO/AO transport system kinase
LQFAKELFFSLFSGFGAYCMRFLIIPELSLFLFFNLLRMPRNKASEKSALKVNQGIDQPSSISPDAAEKFRHVRQQDRSVIDYLDGIFSGNRTLLSRAITLVESALPKHQELAQQIISGCLSHSGKSLRVGITGVPGAGKSTFIEVLGRYLTCKGHHIAVLAIDPSSRRSKGSILGDKTRMEDLANDPLAFIRPSATAGTLGGVARKTRETIILCEAAGYDIIFVETVGVGQSETAVHSMVDFFLLLMLSGAGDELQGIKRGIMEMADMIVINKADGDNIPNAQRARMEYENALHLFPPADSGWTPRVLTCSSQTRDGLIEVWDSILNYYELTRGSGYFTKKRKEQSQQALIDAIDDSLRLSFYSDKYFAGLLAARKKDIMEGKASPYIAARQLMEKFLASRKKIE